MAKTTAFTQRERKLKGYDFFIALTFGALKASTTTLSSLVEILPVDITREAIHHHFNKHTVEFIGKIYQHAFKIIQAHKNKLDVKILNKFKRVNIIDSSSWKIPKTLKDSFPGYNEAGCKLQLMLDYKTGMPALFDLTQEAYPDSNYAKNMTSQIEANDLFIFDQGYGLTNTFNLLAQQGAFFISRFNPHIINIYIRQNNVLEKIDILKLINQLTQRNSINELECYIGNNDKKIKVRFFAIKLPAQAADNKRRKLRRRGCKKGYIPTQKALQLCGWNFLITNIPKQSGISVREIMAFYPIRWTIELFFKQLKSILAIHKTEVKDNEHRLHSEILSKCIAALFISYCYSIARGYAWQIASTEISFEKTVKYFKRNISSFVDSLFISIYRATNLIKQMIIKIILTCQKFRQKSRKNSLDILIDQSIYKNLNLIHMNQSVIRKSICLT